MELKDLELGKEYYFYNKEYKTVVKGTVRAKLNSLDMNDKGIAQGNPKWSVQVFVKEARNYLVLGFNLIRRDLPYVEFTDDNDNYNFYETFEEFKQDTDNLLKDYYDSEIKKIEKEYHEKLDNLRFLMKPLKKYYMILRNRPMEKQKSIKTLDWRGKDVRVDNLKGLSNCEIIMDEEQFNSDWFNRVKIVGDCYISNYATFFAEANSRNIKLRKAHENE